MIPVDDYDDRSGGICLIHGVFAGRRCDVCVAVEREQAERRQRRRARLERAVVRARGWLR